MMKASAISMAATNWRMPLSICLPAARIATGVSQAASWMSQPLRPSLASVKLITAPVPHRVNHGTENEPPGMQVTSGTANNAMASDKMVPSRWVAAPSLPEAKNTSPAATRGARNRASRYMA